ncbi:toll/interleukin-1 receptor domain-containing protein [Halobacteria archaeon HArc-gm2]|nr:toll/interleukin-1 receptor domain-containing protein [Halobacteria archaeon HArc-gm2]
MVQTPDEDEAHDVFISYSHNDSKDVVGLLVEELQAYGLDVWYDDISMSIGDSLRKEMDIGLRNSRYGVIVCSEGYFEGTSEWEFNGLVKKHIDEENVILPVLHGVGHDDILEESHSLADLKYETIDEDNIESVATSIYSTVTGEDGGDGNLREDGESLMASIDIRFQGNFTPDIGDGITITSWRNHHAPRFEELEAAEIRDENGVEYSSRSGGTIMKVARIDDEPLEGVVSDIKTVQSNKIEFTVRIRQSRLDELSDDPSDYEML